MSEKATIPLGSRPALWPSIALMVLGVAISFGCGALCHTYEGRNELLAGLGLLGAILGAGVFATGYVLSIIRSVERRGP